MNTHQRATSAKEDLNNNDNIKPFLTLLNGFKNSSGWWKERLHSTQQMDFWGWMAAVTCWFPSLSKAETYTQPLIWLHSSVMISRHLWQIGYNESLLWFKGLGFVLIGITLLCMWICLPLSQLFFQNHRTWTYRWLSHCYGTFHSISNQETHFTVSKMLWWTYDHGIHWSYVLHHLEVSHSIILEA